MAKPTSRGQRLSVDLEPGQKERLDTVVTWGSQRTILVQLVELFLRYAEAVGFGRAMDALADSRTTILTAETLKTGATLGNDPTVND